MKHILTQEQFLLQESLKKDLLQESLLSLDDIYTKYYSKIDKSIFDKILKADPTYIEKDNKMGIYSKWLLKLHTSKKLMLEDLYKATEYLKTFNLIKHKLDLSNRNINDYKSLSDLFIVVEPFIEKEEQKFESEYERKIADEFKEVFRNDNYRIIIPLTLKASQYFGRDTEWCTTHSINFKNYTSEQTSKLDENCLYILYTENLDDRLQFSFKHRQFMDVDDSGIDVISFLGRNSDIKQFFESKFKLDVYLYGPDEIIDKWCKNNKFSGFSSSFQRSLLIGNYKDYFNSSITFRGIIFGNSSYDEYYTGRGEMTISFIAENIIFLEKLILFVNTNYPIWTISDNNDDNTINQTDNNYDVLNINDILILTIRL